MAHHSSAWENLPKDVLGTVLNKFFPFVEYTRCGLVCKSWLRVAAENYKERLGLYRRIPLFMLQGDADNYQNQTFYNIITKKAVFDLQFPTGRGDRIRGSSTNGWVAIESPENKTVMLFNPIRNKSIQVPRPERINRIRDVIVSARNDCSRIDEANYVIATRFHRSEYLAYIRSGDEDWTYIRTKSVNIDDAVFHKGHLYFITVTGIIFTLDVLSRSTKPKERVVVGRPGYGKLHRCIAKSSTGDLVLIHRPPDDRRDVVSELRGIRIQHLQNRKLAWEEIKELDDGEVVFLGRNESNCVKVPDGHLSNSICYTDDYFQHLLDRLSPSVHRDGQLQPTVKILNPMDGSLETVDKLDSPQQSPSHSLPAIWVFLDMPNFQC